MRNEAEKKEWKDKMQGFIRQVSAMTPEKRESMAAKMGRLVTCEGHVLSSFNTCFLSIQNNGNRGLTVLGGFKQWHKAGRKVMKGEHACGYIYVPLGKVKEKERDGDTGGEGEPEKRGPMRFRLVPVFDVSQTEIACAQCAAAGA